MTTIAIATNNAGKLKEINDLLAAINIKAISPFAIKPDLLEPEETATTFGENALIKARYYGDATNLIALADDSGLCIPALDNAPGVHSARFALDANGNKDFDLAFAKIAQQLQGLGFDNFNKASAYFVCNLCLYNPLNKNFINFEGRVDGWIQYPAKGDFGFGYDPIFIKNGMQQTFAEIEPAQKALISHRHLAFTKLQAYLLKVKPVII
jgi:XTP/dITP diphosphohydrolase